MKRPKIISIVGTRPEAIKMAPVILEFRKHSDRFEHVLVSTSQHKEMLDQVFDAFDIRPDISLGLMKPDQSLPDFASRAMSALGEVMLQERPNLILVQGDTTTVMSASLAAFFHKIPVGHVEAGLRTFDRYNPFPEEVNRRIVSVTADYHFAPTERSRANLMREGLSPESIFVTGNTIVDALRLMPVNGPFESQELRAIPIAGRRLVFVTAHRRENHGEPLRNICGALRALAENFDDVEIVYPVHLNPNVQQIANEELSNRPRIHLVKPLSYPDSLRLMACSFLILTDSGGIQEEAPSLRKPVLILRETTERPEVVDVGAGRLVGTESAGIFAQASQLLENQDEYQRMTHAPNPFGDGHAAEKIVEIVGSVLPNFSEKTSATPLLELNRTAVLS